MLWVFKELWEALRAALVREESESVARGSVCWAVHQDVFNRLQVSAPSRAKDPRVSVTPMGYY